METGERTHEINSITLWGSFVNFLLLALKFVIGILGHSSALVADAIHSFSDFITDFIVLIFVNIGRKPQDGCHDYGHGKFETFATFLIGVILLSVGGMLMYNGVHSVVDVLTKGESLPSPGTWAFVVAVISIVLKEIMYHLTMKVARKVNSQALVANAWHHRSDAFSSIGTAVGIGGAILIGNKWTILDPIAAAVVSIFIIKEAVELLASSVGELTEKSLPEDIENEIISIVRAVDGVVEPHHLRTRRIGNRFAIEVHIRMDGEMTLNKAHGIASQAEDQLKARFGEDTHVAIHMEPIKINGAYKEE
ncbi:MAG: cation diffusion facilitator family transporter [Bacteroidaceae bacterium]|nr:cation diffusion facilitator family transporter [Bacteroidaceae bacterium]